MCFRSEGGDSAFKEPSFSDTEIFQQGHMIRFTADTFAARFLYDPIHTTQDTPTPIITELLEKPGWMSLHLS